MRSPADFGEGSKVLITKLREADQLKYCYPSAGDHRMLANLYLLEFYQGTADNVPYEVLATKLSLAIVHAQLAGGR